MPRKKTPASKPAEPAATQHPDAQHPTSNIQHPTPNGQPPAAGVGADLNEESRKAGSEEVEALRAKIGELSKVHPQEKGCMAGELVEFLKRMLATIEAKDMAVELLAGLKVEHDKLLGFYNEIVEELGHDLVLKTIRDLTKDKDALKLKVGDAEKALAINDEGFKGALRRIESLQSEIDNRQSAMSREDFIALVRPLLYIPAGQAGMKTVRVGSYVFTKAAGRGRHECRFESWSEFEKVEQDLREAGQGAYPILTDFELRDAPLPVVERVEAKAAVPPTTAELVDAAVANSRSRVATRRGELRLMPDLRRRERLSACGARVAKMPQLGDIDGEVAALLAVERDELMRKLEQDLRRVPGVTDIGNIVAGEFPDSEGEEDGQTSNTQHPTPNVQSMGPAGGSGFDPGPELDADAVSALSIDDLKAYAAARGVTERTRDAILEQLNLVPA